MAKKKTSSKSAPKKKLATKLASPSTSQANYPRHNLADAIRIPTAILDQNAGKPCSDDQAAGFVGLKSAHGPTGVEISSGIKYGFLTRPEPKTLEVTDLGRQVLRPKSSDDVTKGYQQAILNAPMLSDVYKHYRGENLPDRQFFDNALEDNFKIPKEKLSEFKDVFMSSLRSASLIAEHEGRIRVLDAATPADNNSEESAEYIDKLRASLLIQFFAGLVSRLSIKLVMAI